MSSENGCLPEAAFKYSYPNYLSTWEFKTCPKTLFGRYAIQCPKELNG